jgi:hypothetical protein
MHDRNRTSNTKYQESRMVHRCRSRFLTKFRALKILLEGILIQISHTNIYTRILIYTLKCLYITATLIQNHIHTHTHTHIHYMCFTYNIILNALKRLNFGSARYYSLQTIFLLVVYYLEHKDKVLQQYFVPCFVWLEHGIVVWGKDLGYVRSIWK